MRRFDVHAHFTMADPTPETERAFAEQAEREGFAAGGPPIARWSPEEALAFMDTQGIEMQLLSMPMAMSPDEARAVNERGAAIVASAPGRFGLLAALPMLDPDHAIEEIRHAADTLGADGFALMTNYDGAYLGDDRFEPVFAELDRRAASVFVHPAQPAPFDRLGLGRPGPLIEFPMDTARTAVDAIFAGLFLRHPRMNVILAHAGGVLPALSGRILAVATKPWVPNPRSLTRDDLRTQLESLYLDTAIAGTEASILPAVAMSGRARFVFGSDYPPAGSDTIEDTITGLETHLTEADRALMEDTFARLFPTAAARAVPVTPVSS
jgi:predicted TIM-barrel fold metal-dependent hydrolase